MEFQPSFKTKQQKTQTHPAFKINKVKFHKYLAEQPYSCNETQALYSSSYAAVSEQRLIW